jgi:hypothetical protein
MRFFPGARRDIARQLTDISKAFMAMGVTAPGWGMATAIGSILRTGQKVTALKVFIRS